MEPEVASALLALIGLIAFGIYVFVDTRRFEREVRESDQRHADRMERLRRY